MGLLNDMKKLLFGAKSVAKSATNKAVESTKEAGKDIAEKSGEYLKKAAGKAEDLGEDIKERAEDFFDVAKDKAADAFEKAKQAGKDLKDKAVDKAEDLFEKDEDELVPEQPPKPVEEEKAQLDFGMIDGESGSKTQKTKENHGKQQKNTKKPLKMVEKPEENQRQTMEMF